MYATKRPTLRIKQADLKCKNGCGFFGNAEWEGYCSKCYRDYAQKERAAQQSRTESSKSHIAGFSKFEEKKRLQSDKKTKYLKNLTPVFRKGSSAKDSSKPEGHRDSRHTNPEVQKLTAEYITLYNVWGETVRKDFLKCVNAVWTRVFSMMDNKPIDEIAEAIQRYYKMFLNRLNTSSIYEEIHADVREQMLDFFEKFIMAILYSSLFCPHITNDEEKDLAIQNRIRKLSWVTAHHLGCCISETSVEVRDLVYTAITDLLGIDSVKVPQDKLACVVRCCRSVMEVLQHCQGGPVSADEFLPALIFIVLKGNPTRLKSNIHYVTRFCNDARIMQGEGGYYFTNLCCAVSFIENLTAESLGMSEEEFEAYMKGDITPVSAWESALVACESMHQIREHLSHLENLSERTDVVQKGTSELKENISKFKSEITKKVSSVLSKTPLTIKPRKSRIKFDFNKHDIFDDILEPEIKPTIVAKLLDDHDIGLIPSENISEQGNTSSYKTNLPLHSPNTNNEKQRSTLHLDVSPCLQLSNPDVNKSVYTTPENGNTILFGLSNINYDIDFSDLSGDNSMADELTPEKHSPRCIPDPFSPVGNACNVLHVPLMPSSSSIGASSIDSGAESLISLTDSKPFETILDKQEEMSFASLPSPLQPTTSQYSGFSKQGWQIPNIPCNTGDYNSLQPLIPTNSSIVDDSNKNESSKITGSNMVQIRTDITTAEDKIL